MLALLSRFWDDGSAAMYTNQLIVLVLLSGSHLEDFHYSFDVTLQDVIIERGLLQLSIRD